MRDKISREDISENGAEGQPATCRMDERMHAPTRVIHRSCNPARSAKHPSTLANPHPTAPQPILAMVSPRFPAPP